MFRFSSGLLLMCAVFSLSAYSLEVSQADWEALKKQVDDLKKENVDIKKANDELATKIAPAKSKIDKVIDNKYGPNAGVSTKDGKLTISGLLQVWYTSFQKDQKGLFQDNNVNGIQDSNVGADQDSFRIRRTELKFNMDIHENVTGVVMIDPAREAQSFPFIPDNQANSGIFKRLTNANLANLQSGAGSAPRLLQDAYINLHGVLPHHDFQVGQFKPWFGEEGIRSSAQLDFAERSMVGFLGDQRDAGASLHGTWWTDRFQYWLGFFNGAGNYHQSAGQFQNRSDDNSDKDFNFRALVRPIWYDIKDDCHPWGRLEIGGSGEMGEHGQPANVEPVDNPLNGLNRRRVWASRYDAWGYYAPGGPVRGWWVRGEWEWQNDRNAPQQVIDLLGQGNGGDGTTQTNGKPFSTQGWYVSTGYKLSDSCWCDSTAHWSKGLEFLFRYEVYQNVTVADLVNPSHTDAFRTAVFTGGINYYIKGHDAKIQLNYNVLHQPVDYNNANRVFHNVRDNNLVLNFQVAY
jgi:hypothetical protein